jgi:hypothetical protein
MPLVVAGLLPDVPASLGASVYAPSFAVRREVNCFFGLSAHSGLPNFPLSQQGLPILFAYVLQINYCGYVLVGMEPRTAASNAAPAVQLVTIVVIRAGLKADKLLRALSSGYQALRFPIVGLIRNGRI